MIEVSNIDDVDYDLNELIVSVKSNASILPEFETYEQFNNYFSNTREITND